MLYISPFRGRNFLNVKQPSCVWIYEAEIKGIIYGPSKLCKILRIDENGWNVMSYSF